MSIDQLGANSATRTSQRSSFIPHCLAVAIAMASSSIGAAPDKRNHDKAIELIEVTAEKPSDADAQTVFSEAAVTRPTHDAGELLRSVTGMTALRRGGRGFDPIIRGQSQANLNIISNGAFNYGACPGRMDPPSTYVGVDSFDSVQVIKGHRTVVHGSGGSGGTLLFEHLRPEFLDGTVQGQVKAGYTSNSELSHQGIDVAAGGEQGYLRLFAARKRSENYEDGNGQVVASAFDSDSWGMVTAWDIGVNDSLELSHEDSQEGDVWYAGNGMDAVYADSRSTALKWAHDAPVLWVDRFEANVYRSDVEHLMDNYTVRNRNGMPNGMAAPSSSDTWGGRFLATIERGNSEWRFGFDHQANDRRATLFMDRGKDGSLDMQVARMWPDVEQRQWGLFGEMDYQWNEANSLRLGLRFDDYESRANTATVSTGMMGASTPSRLYEQFYKADGRPKDDSAVSAVIGWDVSLDKGRSFNANLSRSVRRPDVTEQWIARAAMGSLWVGNPDVDAEVHQQLDISLQQSHGQFGWAATAFYNDVDDYIEQYKQGNNTLYRNIDAELFGSELDVRWQLTQAFSAKAGLSYTRGRGDNGDLAQIAPLEARINMDYQSGDWAVGAEWIVSSRQNHFNPDVDVNEASAGFSVVHLYGHWNITEALLLEAGIENLADKAYAYHVNSANSDPFNPDAVRVNEPGRQSWIKVRYQF
ncbi:TonB-dependent copper receptor [Pseudoteredinibacter isoporae]|uniref:TonB-dependent copper receptor n=1 Tax=Pseudoteredinibacter isoporae TaxID=570281 RepID=UPI00310639E6